jgi:glycosyltransferase involved in cell wall biosynthesis
MMQAHRHLLLYEPRTEGHHLGWLRFIVEDLLSANFQLSLAVDLRPAARPRVEQHLEGLLSEVKLLPARDEDGRLRGGRRAGSVAFCLRKSGAERVFLCALDEIASHAWRSAALGLLPPAELQGRMGGIYHRPRFFIAPRWSPDRMLKLTGWRRLLTNGWLAQVLFVDEYLAADLQREHPSVPIFFLPDPCPTPAACDGAEARRLLGVPADKPVFLFYGGGYRRKGLHLAAQAMSDMPATESAFLLCVGQQNPTGETARQLDRLVEQGRARVINRYVSVEEEQLSFAAADAVLLPYINHFGTSGVLSRAMAAGKMVIASDEQLLGRLVREHGLGLLFPSGDVAGLGRCIQQAAASSDGQIAAWSVAAKAYAERYSRRAYRDALLASLGASRQEK